jgi:hypothetical protein
VTALKFQYTLRSPYLLFLRRLQPEMVFSSLDRSLTVIGDAIRQSARVIDGAQGSGNADYIEFVTDEEVELIESLLGTAFVICQTNITSVVSRIKDLHSFFRKREGRPLGALRFSKEAILKQGSDGLPGSAYSIVEAIDAFANYFKHREEWPSNWTLLSSHQAHTRDIISACGASPGSTGNLRAGAEALGNSEFDAVLLLAEQLEVWRAHLVTAHEEELKREGVI